MLKHDIKQFLVPTWATFVPSFIIFGDTTFPLFEYIANAESTRKNWLLATLNCSLAVEKETIVKHYYILQKDGHPTIRYLLERRRHPLPHITVETYRNCSSSLLMSGCMENDLWEDGFERCVKAERIIWKDLVSRRINILQLIE